MNWRNAWQLLGRVGLIAGLAFPSDGKASPAEPAAKSIDRSIVLRIGPNEVSRYRMEKYYGRFTEETRQRQQRAPLEDENARWLELFLAKQVLIARASELGYCSRPEVIQTVERMERHMLSQPPAGPVSPEPPLSADRLQALYRRSLTIADAIVARFSSEPELTAAVGADFARCPLAEQTQRVLRAREWDDVKPYEGPLSWPYAPFLEIGEILANAPPGRWLQHHDPVFGFYLVLIRSISTPPAAAKAAAPHFAALAQQVEAQVVQSRRSRSQLAAASLSIERPTARSALELWQTLPRESAELPVPSASATASLLLARYQIDGQTISVSLREFCGYFNGLFARRIPRDWADLQQAVEDMVSAELNLRTARREGVDRTPQFTEDRQAFAGFQALDIFEKEKIIPNLAIGEPDIQRYYREHLDEFQRVTRIRGRWLEFPTALSAVLWVQTNERSGDSPVERQTELVFDKPLPGLENLRGGLFGSPAGARIGPFRHGQNQVIFIKEADVAKGPVPLAEIRETIRQKLVRSAVETQELALSAEYSSRYEIEDHIDCANYGAARAALSLPWKR